MQSKQKRFLPTIELSTDQLNKQQKRLRASKDEDEDFGAGALEKYEKTLHEMKLKEEAQSHQMRLEREFTQKKNFKSMSIDIDPELAELVKLDPKSSKYYQQGMAQFNICKWDARE